MLNYWSRQCNDNNNSNDEEEDANNNSISIEKEVPYHITEWDGTANVPYHRWAEVRDIMVQQADEIWSIDEDVLESILLLLEEENDNNTKVVAIPIIDVGMAHGEKARGGALF